VEKSRQASDETKTIMNIVVVVVGVVGDIVMKKSGRQVKS